MKDLTYQNKKTQKSCPLRIVFVYSSVSGFDVLDDTVAISNHLCKHYKTFVGALQQEEVCFILIIHVVFKMVVARIGSKN